MKISELEKKWLFRKLPSHIPEEQVSKISRDFGISGTLARVLALKGLSDVEHITDFMAPSLQQLPRPHLMKGMREAVAILLDALKTQKPVTVFGDFDADGVTATAVLSLFFNELGVPLQTYIPDRLTEGYGLNNEAIRKIHDRNREQWGQTGVLLTADCGISDTDVVEEARKIGFSVIITDHHKPPDKIPRADAILNPLQPNCSFPCKNLAGVGVAFYLILGLRSELATNGHWPEDRIPNLKSYMDLVAIGTVADQVPVTGCNRIIVKAGLEVLAQTGRVGLQKLMGSTRSGSISVSAEDIAFRMAPRINAVGRIGSAARAVKLLTTDFPEEAQQCADELEEANNYRKSIEAGIFDQAVHMVAPDVLASAHSIVLYKNDWHQGVLGIVASRLSEHFHRPTILLTDYSDVATPVQTRVKGSGRSITGIDIHRAVSACQDILERFGGHEGAVGLTLQHHDIALFTEMFDTAIAEQMHAAALSKTPSLLIDGAITLQELTDPAFLLSYAGIGPFGRGNEEPVFCLLNQQLGNMRQVGTNHLRFTIEEKGRSINGIGFDKAHHIQAARNTMMDLAFTLRLNSFRGTDSWELLLVDLRPSQNTF